jgi:UDP-glucuronate 4-epimerase
MNILVTGGAGFIGSHLVERLLNSGHSIVCLDNFDTYYDPALKRRNLSRALTHREFILMEGDIRDRDSLQSCFAKRTIDAVIHLAARAGVRPSIANPGLYYEVNVMGTLNLLEAMREHEVRKLVFGSSSSVYGDSPEIPFSESANVDHPISPYAASKKAGELLCHTYHHLYGFDIHALRFFTAYGPRQRPDMGIQIFIRNIIEGKPITLYGEGDSRRDYTFVGDIVQGIELSVGRVEGYQVMNLGESRTTTLLDLVRIIETQLGKKAAINWQPSQPGDVQATYADIRKAAAILGYAPSVTVHEGIRLACEWNIAGELA